MSLLLKLVALTPLFINMKKILTPLIIVAVTFLMVYSVVQAVTILTVPQGGTGWGSPGGFQSNTVLVGNGTGKIATTTAGTNGFVLALVSGVPTWVATSTLSTISGTLQVSGGGTGQTTFTSGRLLYGAGTGAVQVVATTSETCTAPISCTAHDVLTGGGAITLGTVPLANGGTNATSFAANSIITSNAAGTALIATSSNPLSISTLNSTSTATSTFAGALGVGSTSPYLTNLAVQGNSTDPTTYNSFTTFPSTATRNDANFTIGYFFSVPESITVSQLGRFYATTPSINNQNHKVIIWSMADGSIAAQGTVLAASGSDGNGFKYVAITPVTLTPDKTYAITINENAGGDTWTDIYPSSGFFSPYIKRLGFAYHFNAIDTFPDSIQPGTSIYDSPAMKFTTEGNPQQKIAYDSANFLNILSRSDGSASIFPSKIEKGVAIGGGAAVGKGGFSGTTAIGATNYPTTFEVAGLQVITGGYPALIITDGTTPFSFGANAGNGASLRWAPGNVVLNSNGVLYLNYDNGTETILNGAMTWAAKSDRVQLSVNAFSTQSTNLMEWRGFDNLPRSVVNGIGSFGIGTSSPRARLDVTNVNDSTNPLFQLSKVVGTATTTIFIADSNGNVGIGTSTNTNNNKVIVDGSLVSFEGIKPFSATPTFDWSARNQWQMTMTSNVTSVTFTGLTPGAGDRLMLCQDGTGSRTVAGWGTNIIWSGGTAPVQTATLNKCDIYTFTVSNGTSTLKAFGGAVQNF